MQAQATTAKLVPGLSLISLLSTSKLACANYIMLFTPDEVKKFDGETTLRWFEMDRDVRCLQTKITEVTIGLKS